MTIEEILLELYNDPNAYVENKRWCYKGLLNKTNKNKIISKAYRIWSNQGDRCNNPKDKAFKDYGAKNIKREWSSKDFIEWYINKLLTRNKWIKPHVSRNKDKGNYSIDNCDLLEATENIRDMHKNKVNNIKDEIINVLKMHKVNGDIVNDIEKLFDQ